MNTHPMRMAGILLAASLLIFPGNGLAARNWNISDTDLPTHLQGLSQEQLDIINKTDELNPDSPKFNPGLLMMFINAATPVVRTNQGTTVLPHPGADLVQSTNGGPTGIGLGPAASDGPVQHAGEPLGNPKAKPVSPADQEANEAAFGLFFGELFLSEDDMADFYEDIYSGSGGAFGDCLGPDCVPRIGFPGEPLGGRTFGRNAYNDRSMVNFRFNTDANVLDAIRQGDIAQAQQLIENQIGQPVQVDPRGRGF